MWYNLGDYSYGKYTAWNSQNVFALGLPDIIQGKPWEYAFGYCSLYPIETPNNVLSGIKNGMVLRGDNKTVYIANLSYTDATTFKAAMQGIYLYYELAEEIVMPVDGNEIGEKLKQDLNGYINFLSLVPNNK